MGPRILAATGGEQIILSGHRQRLTEIEVAVISYELRSLDLSSFVRLALVNHHLIDICKETAPLSKMSKIQNKDTRAMQPYMKEKSLKIVDLDSWGSKILLKLE